MKDEDNGKRTIEWFRIITPALVTVSIFLMGMNLNETIAIREKLFHHLTNSDMHVPREQIATQAEFKLHCDFSEQNYSRIASAIDKLEKNLREYIDKIMGIR